MHVFSSTLLLAELQAASTQLSAGMIVLYIAGIIFFLLLNAFFVASEFAIV